MPVEIPKTIGLSDEQIRAAERALGCTLPASVRAFVRDHDGARLADNAFDLPDNRGGVRSFISLTEASVLRQQIEGFPKRGLPIAEDGCGNYVWLEPETGEILFWDHEIEDDSILIANDFGAFLAALQPFDPMSVVLKPGQVQSAWIDSDFLAEQKKLGNG
jgi:hypothetical protein